MHCLGSVSSDVCRGLATATQHRVLTARRQCHDREVALRRPSRHLATAPEGGRKTLGLAPRTRETWAECGPNMHPTCATAWPQLKPSLASAASRQRQLRRPRQLAGDGLRERREHAGSVGLQGVG